MEKPQVINSDTLSKMGVDTGLNHERIVDKKTLDWIRTTGQGPEETDWQYHDGLSAYSYVLSGGVEIQYGDDESFDLQRGDFVHIPSETVHRMFLSEKKDLDMLTILLGDGTAFQTVENPTQNRGEDEVMVVTSGGVKQADSTPGVDRKSIFENEEVIVIKGDVEGGNVSNWHRHPNREVCSYNISGDAEIEFEAEGIGTLRLESGNYINIPPALVHRASADPGGQVAIAFFVGDGPLVKNMEK